MSQFKQIFNNFPVILPVIHVESLDQTLRNVEIARQHDSDGVFLINHGSSCLDLLAIHHNVFNEFPDWWLGVNCLDLEPWEIFDKLTPEVAGVWVDNAYIDEQTEHQRTAEKIQDARTKSGWQGLYFGGVAFKYQREVSELERAALLATPYMDIVTTSGPGTGKAAQVSKIQRMKQAIGSFPLAIASGITPENVHHYLNLADCFLVATGISHNLTELDPKLVRNLVARVRGI